MIMHYFHFTIYSNCNAETVFQQCAVIASKHPCLHFQHVQTHVGSKINTLFYSIGGIPTVYLLNYC